MDHTIDLIAMTKAVGRALQQDERYIRYHLAKSNNDDDAALQEAIGQFNCKRVDLNNELNRGEEADKEKLQTLNEEVRALYGEIMQNENMAQYNVAKQELDVLLNQMQTILTYAANGEDVDEIDLSSCAGDCSSCAGCGR